MELLSLDLNKLTPDLPTEGELRFQVSLLASVSAVAASFAGRFLFDAPLVPELLAQFIFAVAPIWIVEIAVGMLGPFAKHLAFLGCTAIYLIVLMAAAISYQRYWPLSDSRIVRRIARFGFAMCVWAFTGAVVLPLVGAGVFGNHLRQGWLITSSALLVAHLVYGIALTLAIERYVEREAALNAPNKIISRRRVVRAVGYSVLAIGIYDIGKSLLGSWLGSGSGRVKGGNGVFPEIENLALEVTPAKDFYQVSKNAFDPQVDSRRWKLDVTGLVENPGSFSYEDMKALPAVEQYATLACISNEVGGDLIGTALWRGVRLKDVLNQAVLKPGVVDIFLRASDDYTDSIPLDRALADEACRCRIRAGARKEWRNE